MTISSPKEASPVTDRYVGEIESTTPLRAVDERLKKRGQETVWRRDVRWVFVKEEGPLKIHSVDDWHDQSP